MAVISSSFRPRRGRPRPSRRRSRRTSSHKGREEPQAHCQVEAYLDFAGPAERRVEDAPRDRLGIDPSLDIGILDSHGPPRTVEGVQPDRGPHEAGIDGDDLQARARELRAEILEEPRERVLGRGVGRPERHAREADETRNRHDAPPAPQDHGREAAAQHVDLGPEIQVHHAVEGLGRGVEEGRTLAYARIEDENVDRAEEGRGLRAGRRESGGVEEVEGEEGGRRVARFTIPGDLGEGLGPAPR
jgi:hypothetical protein